MADYPPLSRYYIASYAANDRDFPVVAIRLDPRTAGYKVPEDLSPHPDSKRYPNHVFTGAQPSSGDQVVTHVYEILPSPWVPFTRYDDDLGPVQGRRRSVKNEGQVATLAADKRVNYEAREGSAIVYTEIEETWSIEVDEDGNSLFPVKDRDFYDPSRGAVQERRQLFVPTGEEEGSLENVNGVITQTSYEPYNEFLSVKIVQTYSVNGPQLIGKATDNDGQLVTVTTQRKGADGYIPPNPTATRTVEVSREDAESLVERVVDTPEVFTAKTFSLERPDPIPQKFRVAVPLQSNQEVVAGEAELPTLLTGEISRTEEQRNKFIKRTTATSRDQTVLPKTLTQKATNNERQEVTITETLQLGDTDEVPTATKTVESEALGDGNFVVRKTEVPEVFAGETYRKAKEDITPQKFKAAQEDTVFEQTIAGIANPNITLDEGEFAKSEEQVNKFVKRVSTTSRAITSAVTLSEKVLTPEGLIGSRVLTLASGNQSFTPSAKMIDASVEALGDGRTVKTETTIPKIFDGKSIRKSKPDLTPEKFRAQQEELLTEENVEGTVDNALSLGGGEFSKTEQQVTEFVKRISTTSRDITAAVSLQESILTPQGQRATRTIRLANGPQTINPSATLIDASVEELGDGRTIKTEITVPVVFDEKQESKQKPDIIPPEFRASLQDLTTAEVKAGTTATVGQLAIEEVSKTVQRITEQKVRETKTVRAQGPYPALNEQLIDNDGIKVSRKRTVVDGAQFITPTATVSGQVQALGDGYTLKIEDTKAKVFRGSTFSQEKPDNIPVEFRAEKPATTEEFSEEGEAAEISLADDEIAKSEQQVTEFVKRVRTTTRDLTNAVTLDGGQQVDEDGVKVTIRRTLANGAQDISPSATVRGQVEDIGDGKTIKNELTRDEIFEGQIFSVEKPEVIPVAFRAEKPSKVDEKTVEGDVEDVSLEGDEISKSEQQITKFLKRIRTTTRENVGTVELKDEQINQFGQKVDVTRTLSKSGQSISPSATISGNVEALGDDYTLKTEEKLPEVFDGLTKAAQKPDVIPEKFRVNAPVKRTEEILEKNTADEPTLSDTEYSKTEQRITEFTVQKTTVEREDTLNEVASQRLEENWGINIPYKEYVSNSIPSGSNIEAEGLSDTQHLVREYDKTQLDQNLSSFSVTIPSSIDLDIPRELDDITVDWQKEESTAEQEFDSNGQQGSFKSLTQEDKGYVSSSLTLIPRIQVSFKDRWGKNLPSKIHLFFLKKDQLNDSQIRSKVGATANWPSFKLVSLSTTVYGVSETKSMQATISRAIQVNDTSAGYGYVPTKGDQTESSRRLIPVSVNIPPCLSAGKAINETETLDSSGLTINLSYPTVTLIVNNDSATLTGPNINKSLDHNIEANVNFSVPASGEQNTVPTSGTYLISSSVEPYKFEWFLVRAITLDASVFS